MERFLGALLRRPVRFVFPRLWHTKGETLQDYTALPESDYLTAATIEDAVHPDFKRMSSAFREYAIAGTLHLDHLADLAEANNHSAVKRHAALTGAALGMEATDVEGRLVSMLERHAAEWNRFTREMGARSFIRKWTRASQ
jgi:hypothetical protein